jgi:hypothetical protein
MRGNERRKLHLPFITLTGAKPVPAFACGVHTLCGAQKFRYLAAVAVQSPTSRLAMRAAARAIALAVFAVALASSARAACTGNCEPTVDAAKETIEETLKSAFLSPFTLVSFEKVEGHAVDTKGRRIYQMRIRAVLNYAGIRLRCRRKLCPELHHYVVQIDAASKKATILGWLFFEQDDVQGWHRFDAATPVPP